MARRPDIKSDRDDWGAVLNDYLDVSLAEDGTLKGEAIGEAGGVFGVGVRRIIASTDPDYPLEDGDLLVLIEMPVLYTDFAQYDTGVAPSDWSKPWADGAWTVEADAEATGGKVLRLVNTTTGRYLLSWDTAVSDPSASADVEIVAKWRADQTDASMRLAIRGSGAGGAETGYVAGYQSTGNSVAAFRYVDGAATTFAPASAPAIDADTWYVSRLRMIGTSLSYRTWAASDPEPETWTTTGTEAVVTAAGYVGLIPFGAATIDIDWVGVAFAGSTAPMEAS